MLFGSTTANIAFFLSCSTLVLWSGPGRFIPGYRDSLPVAQTRQGLARGDLWASRDGRYFSVFRGIPYAKQPVGRRRFKPPVALDEEDTWEDIKDFNREMSSCYQIDPNLGFHIGQEECLKLNVYSADMNPDNPLPVMVWIHGGGFVAGDGGSTMLGPHYLMDHDVVLVTLHYRLGILGFLSLENEAIPGNQGLWDQRMALLWVKRNIKKFGGDPSRVTIFGESAGSMSVNFHLVSPQSKGLFHQAIMQSGTAISPYTSLSNPPAHYARSLATAVGCSGPDTVGCLQSASPGDLYKHILMFDECSVRADLGLTFPGPWVPVVDNYLEEPFLPRDPEEILKDGKENKVPVMIGFTKEDGLLYTTRFIKDPEFEKHFNDNWDTCAPINLLGKESHAISDQDIEYVNNLRKSYSSNSDQIKPAELTTLFTDAVFGLSTHKVAKYLAQSNKSVYKYIFSYRGSSSVSDVFSYPFWKTALYMMVRMFWMYPTQSLGTSHGDDLMYLFQMTPIIDLIPSSMDKKVSRDMVTMWTNFAKNGDPNGEDRDWVWYAAGAEDVFDNVYFIIDKDLRMEKVEELDRFKLWMK
eukprot:GFUD01022894.1.p1 GENE.GFUD01022894.1~~GFUD01022894.1.p1  ORF type:complete len:581 (+),score=136.25 GFUD01022894.1:59-1801(+)